MTTVEHGDSTEVVVREPSTPMAAPVSGRRTLWGIAWKSLMWALVVSLLLEASVRVGGGGPLGPGPALVGAVLVWSMILACVGLFGSLRTGVVVVGAIAAVLGAVNVGKLKILLVPVLPGDIVFLRSPGFLLEMVGPALAVASAAVLVLIVGALVWVARRRRWGDVPEGPAQPRWWRGCRLVAAAQGVVMLLACSGFNAEGNPLRGVYEAAGAQWMPWSQKANYLFNGFVGGALYNLTTDPMAMPEGYSRKAMEEIAARWEAAGTSATSAGQDRNLVVVLSESLGDLTAWDGVAVDPDPMKPLRPTIERSLHGELVSTYGTGTSSMEFQVLTGQSTSLFRPQITSPFQQFVSESDEYPSAVSWFSRSRGTSVAVHPYTTEMYKRTQVYPVLGFDDFVHEGRMGSSPDRLGGDGFITDARAYREVLDQLTRSEEPQMVHLVTMQNHLPYAVVKDGPRVTGIDDDHTAQVSAWSAGVARTAKATVEFLEDLSSLDEDTVVVFFGDHFPGIFPPQLVDSAGSSAYRTPFFIWTSRDDATSGAGRDVGTVSPAALLPLALDEADIALPPYLRFVKHFQEQVGALEKDTVVRPDGSVVPLRDLGQAQKALVEQYRLLQFDSSVGERWVTDRLWGTPDGVSGSTNSAGAVN